MYSFLRRKDSGGIVTLIDQWRRLTIRSLVKDKIEGRCWHVSRKMAALEIELKTLEMYVCICIYVCMYVCMYQYVCVCVCEFIYFSQFLLHPEFCPVCQNVRKNSN